MAKRQTLLARVRSFALSLPEAYEDHPWGESVAKVNKKVFVFMGHDDDPKDSAMSVKLADSNAQALLVPGAQPTGYGLGRGGWVTVPLNAKSPPLDVLTDWVEESYRLVAPRRFGALLDERAAKAAKAPAKAKATSRASRRSPRRS